MGKKKGKKSGEQVKKEEKQEPQPPQAESAGASGGGGDAPPKLQGAVGGVEEGAVGQQKKKKQKQQTPPPATTVSEPASPPPEETVSQPTAPSQQQKKKKQKQHEQTPPPEPVAPLPEPAAPSQQQKKKKQKQHEQTPPPEPVAPPSEPAAPPPQQQKKKKQKQHEQTPPPEPVAPPPVQTEPAPTQKQQKKRQQKHEETPPPEQSQRSPPGFARGRQDVPQERRPGPPRDEQFPTMQQPQPRAQPTQQVVSPPPGMTHPRPLAGRGGPPQPAVRGPSPPQAMGPSSAVRGPSPPQAMRPSPAVRGPSPPQAARPAPGTYVPVTQPPPDRGVAAITKGLQTLSIPSRKFRDRCGTKGRPIIVETNHLALDLSRLKNNIITHYDVNMVPDLPKRLLRAAVEEFRKNHYPTRYPAFDGRKNLYSSGQLPFGGEISDEVEVQDEESNRNKTFKITIKYASQVDLASLRQYMRDGTSLRTPQEAIQAIDVVLRCAPAFRFVQVGRSFFTEPREMIIPLGDGMDMWYGFFQSAILGWKPFVNVDVAHKGFPSPKSVPEAMCDVLQWREGELHKEMNEWDKRNFLKYLKGLKIDYQLPNVSNSKRTYKVNNLVESAVKQRFELDNGRTISVGEYFEKEKRVRLRYPYLPCLHVGSMNRPKPIYVPAELCTITKGQVLNRKMTEIQTSNMIKQAATSTDERKRKIQDALRQVGFNSNPFVAQEFGLSVSETFERVQARILDPPVLEYKKDCRIPQVNPVKGVWRPSSFLSTNRLSNWAILSLNKFTREDELRRFGVEMQKMGRSLGMNIDPPGQIDNLSGTRELERYFKSLKSKAMQLVVVVVPDKGDTYSKVKREAEVNVGVLTQCIKGKTMQRMNPATCSNILLKVNSKLNGINHTLATRPRMLNRPIMIVGADVTHPSPDQTDIPSVAAVCASHDPKAFKYNIQVRLQPPREEMILDLESIMKEQLMFFYKSTKCKPEKIVFYRDGVSEGQFAQVLNTELMAIRRACASLDREYKPQVTFLVVQKRHHTRFFPTRREDCDGRNNNVPAGTVVDRDITHPSEVDFYLVSHASIQGVSRPTKYRLLWNDDESMTEDELEEMTYYLCHMFSRCTRSVSYPAPTYNAHLAAYRARVYLEGERINVQNLAKEQRRCTVLEEILKGNPMFFV